MPFTPAMPEITFWYAWAVDAMLRRLHEPSDHPGKEHLPYPEPEEIFERMVAFEERWRHEEAVLVRGMQEVLGLSFLEHHIEVNVIGRGSTASRPLMLSSEWEPEDVVDVLAHELTHKLIYMNEQGITRHRAITAHFPNEPKVTQNHIFVHAALIALYMDVLQDPMRLAKNRTRERKYPDYARSFDIVEARGDKEILALLHGDGIS